MGFGTQNSGRHDAAARRALTLVELLVVIVLLATLVSTAIPIISPGGEGRRLREAARNVNAYLQGAQARAIQTGRPFGVALRRLSSDTERGADNAVCVRMEYVEVPPAYSGFSETSAVRIAINAEHDPLIDSDEVEPDDDGPLRLQFVARPTAGGVTTGPGLPAGYVADLVPPRFLRPGDTVEVDGQRYTLLGGVSSETLANAASGYFEPPTGVLVTFAATWANAALNERRPLAVVHDNSGAPLPDAAALARQAAPGTAAPAWAGQDVWTEPKPYKVFRQPVPAAGEPYELPAGTAVDLQASVLGNPAGEPIQLYDPSRDFGTTSDPFPNVNETPLMILFTPEGRIHRLHGLAAALLTNPSPPPRTVSTFVALCVGRRELIPGQPFNTSNTPPQRSDYANPIRLNPSSFDALSETEQKEATDQFNWLNLESRWVVMAGQTGSVSTIEGVSIFTGGPSEPQLNRTPTQIARVLEGVATGRKIGGG